jgi:hypothetical protein
MYKMSKDRTRGIIGTRESRRKAKKGTIRKSGHRTLLNRFLSWWEMFQPLAHLNKHAIHAQQILRAKNIPGRKYCKADLHSSPEARGILALCRGFVMP